MREANTDPLTGLLNRRGFDALAGPALRAAVGRTATLVVADLDNMKWVNDTHGHAAGDQLLRDAATVLRQSFRTSDLLARVGGDEFLALVLEPGPPPSYAERIERAVADFNRTSGSPCALAVSVGEASLGVSDGFEFAALAGAADAAMYEAKAHRRASAGTVGV